MTKPSQIQELILESHHELDEIGRIVYAHLVMDAYHNTSPRLNPFPPKIYLRTFHSGIVADVEKTLIEFGVNTSNIHDQAME